MKILNHIKRDETGQTEADETMSMEVTPVSKLNQTTSLNDKSLIHVVEYCENAQYESKKMLLSDFKEKVYQSVQNTLKTKYWDTHCSVDETSASHNKDVDNEPPGSSFKEIVAYLKKKDYAPDEVSTTDPDGFVNHIDYDFTVLRRYITLRDTEIQTSFRNLDTRVYDLECHFSPDMTLHSTKLNSNGDVEDVVDESINHNENDNTGYCQMSISDGNKISNTWTCPATGNLVIYGWLDSTKALNNKAIPSAYCVIEGYINKQWEVIGAQPVIPAKNITYVGFNMSVKKGLQIRARTGFTVGAKSGQYSNGQDGYDTLSNNTANGFKCMVFTDKEGEQTT